MNNKTEDTISGIFEQRVKENPNAPAVICENGTLTRKELFDLSNKIASMIPDGSKRVGVIMDHSPEMTASLFAVLRTGAAYIPVEPFFPRERIRFMMSEPDAETVIVNSKYKNIVKCKNKIIIDSGFDFEGAGYTENKSAPSGLAYILYTSGTTGRPKGVAVTNANVCHYVSAFQNEFHPDENDIMLQYSVCSFDIFVEEVFASLLSGAALAIPSPDDKANINNLMSFADKNRVTMISGFPYLLQEMNELSQIPQSLRLLISGGDVLREAYITNLKDKVTVYNTYGPSETTVCASYYNCSGGYALPDGTYPVGKPVLGTQIKIEDENSNPLPNGEAGEICIFGGGVSNGYIGKRDEENKAFVTLENGKRMYKSGDLGYVLNDGNIAFLHRKDTQVMIYGKRVEVSEVENVLIKSSLVKQAFVCPKIDENGLSYMAAYIVKNDKKASVKDIKSYLSEYLTSYMIPEIFVEMDSLPLTPNGKVDISSLPEVSRNGG